jgi:replicative DNA helicase
VAVGRATHAVAGGSAEAGRVPPQDLEAERAVLSALMLDNRAIHSVLTEVKPDDFYHPAHVELYRSMLVLQDENQPVDLHTLADYLNTKKRLDAIGGPVFLAEIADYEATAANVVQHARIVRDKSIKRRLITVASEIVETSLEQAGSGQHLLDVAQAKMFEINQAESRVTFRSLDSELHDAMDHVEALMARSGELTGVPTGFKDLDVDTGGLQPGELVVIAARPSMGKTALALNIARNAAVDHGKRVAIFSLEMTRLSLMLRLLASEAKVDFNSFRKGYGTPKAHTDLIEAANRLSRAKIWIDDSGMITILEVRAKCRRLKSEEGLDLVILDYLQLAHGDNPVQRKDLEIGEISHGLKSLAKELGIPVMALSQLNRGPEQRDPDKRRPHMGDLRESGAIEQDADVVAFIYRDEVYNRDTPERGVAELIVAKQRNGPTGTIKLQFEGRYANFRSLSRDERADLGLPERAGFAPEPVIEAPDSPGLAPDLGSSEPEDDELDF